MLQDPPFSRLDLISCRNLLIYLEPEAQKRVLGIFHFALREDGHLFLGPAETVAGREGFFQPVSKKWRIYRRIGPTRHDLVEFPIGKAADLNSTGATEPAALEPRAGARDLLDQALIERHAPASVLIDAHHHVHYFRGRTEDYLGPPSGEPTHDLIAIARPGLRIPLRTAIRRVLEEKQEVTADARVRRSDGLHPVRLVVTPLKAGHGEPSWLMVSFFARGAASDAVASGATEELGEGQLQAELDTAREDLRLTIKQMETTNEELKASNEEIRSINEELQASNEELETSKEELQSLNEELNTVNNQLQAKVGELEQRTDDLNNLLNSSDVGTLFLDRSLCIRWFTPSMKALLELLPTDLGRPVSHFAQRFSGGDLLEDARKVLERFQSSDIEVVDDLGRWYIRHMVPYRTAHDRIDGVVVTFTEITQRKRWEEELQLLARELSHRVKNTLAVVQSLAMQTDGGIQSVEAFRETFVGRLQALARAHGILLDTNWRSADLKTLVEQTLAAYRIDHPEVVEIEGEPIALTPQRGLGLSLMLHELGTNAAKYGALSQPEGRLRVSWQVEERSERRVRLRWEERDGPRVEAPAEKGFGLHLIERAASYELEGAAELSFAAGGLTCEIVFPLE